MRFQFFQTAGSTCTPCWTSSRSPSLRILLSRLGAQAAKLRLQRFHPPPLTRQCLLCCHELCLHACELLRNPRPSQACEQEVVSR